MSENQNDKRNQPSDSKSHQEQKQFGKKKEETNPNNPTANKKTQGLITTKAKTTVKKTGSQNAK